MISLAFVTPAYRRYELTAVCADHRLRTIAALREYGIEATAIYVADDENLEIARARGYSVVERANDYLGARWNDGYEEAGRLGVDYVVPMGSDSWISPGYFSEVPALDRNRGEILSGRLYAIVSEDVERLAELRIPFGFGVGPHVVSASYLAPYRYRPVSETIQRGCDGSLLRRIARRRRLRYRWSDPAPVGYVGWRTLGEQINPYDVLLPYATRERRDVRAALIEGHDEDLVDRALALYREETP